MIELKLQECRVELQQMKLKKSGENTFAKFKYYELGDFLPVVNKMFAEKKMFSNFSIYGDKATLTIIDCEDKSAQIFTSDIADANVKGCTPIQNLGSVHTYLKRYLYLNALEIIESDALDKLVGDKNFLDDEKYYLGVAKTQTVDELNKYYLSNKNKVSDIKQFESLCKSRKAVLTGAVA